MSKIMEDRVRETAVEIAKNLLKEGVGKPDVIARATGLSVEKINSLAKELKINPQ